MKLYKIRSQAICDTAIAVDAVSDTSPGFTISELLDLFYVEGVTPQFVPADLGTDESTELTSDGWPAVDPLGDIRSSRLDLMRAAKMASSTEGEPVVTSGFDDDIKQDGGDLNDNAAKSE